VVLWHDWDPDDLIATVRQLGFEPNVKYKPLASQDEKWRKPVHKLSLQELRGNYGYALKKKSQKENVLIPTFEEVITWVTGKDKIKLIILDIKTPPKQKNLLKEMISAIQTKINEYNPDIKFVFMSPEKEIIKEMKKHFPLLNYTYDIELPVAIVLDPPAYSCVDKAIKLENHFASAGRPTVLQLGPWTTLRRLLKYDLIQKKKYENSDQNIEALLTWTINKKREMKCLIKMGVNGMVTDQPDRLKKIYDKLSG